jgi:hypothetical protein
MMINDNELKSLGFALTHEILSPTKTSSAALEEFHLLSLPTFIGSELPMKVNPSIQIYINLNPDFQLMSGMAKGADHNLTYKNIFS